MTVARLTFNPFGENTYVVSDPTGECIVIDAGNYSAREDAALDDHMARNGLRPVMAVNTHGHVDHILGVKHVRETYNAKLAIDSRDGFLLESAPMHGRLYGFEAAPVAAPEIDLQGRESVEFGQSRLQIIHTPGHTQGHVCLFEPQQRILFTGDTLFRESIGRTDLPGGDYTWIMKSILERIIPLGDDVTIYPGHGGESTIGHETLYNPFVVEVLQGCVSI
ncbi:MAG: MBL fold metallo-hydrolase [Rikenellaceae bacterium]|nr:MBL fold metallo-hydrolase [Rikenellaceae bacterium]